MDDLTRNPVTASDPVLHATLLEAALPIEDLETSNGRFFRFDRNGVLAGFGGFEPYGPDALLRSVVVAPQMRGSGTGRAIADALFAEMRDAGIKSAYLLTTTAEDFFAHLGFAEIERKDAPASILATPQATTICSSAALLSRRL
jgi:N-acetylglutamate synthase-like GNAT family acetyltransferase